MIKTIYSRVWSALLQKPIRLWGISLLSVLLSGLASGCFGAVPIVGVAVAALLELGMSAIFLRGYRKQAFTVEMLFDGFHPDLGRKLGGTAWTALFIFLWGLIPVAGIVFAIIRRYEYAFVPYILMERPDVKATEARKVSKQETDGWKGVMFGADILLGVLVLAAFLCLILLGLIPLIGILFRLILALFVIACIAFLPLIYGLMHAAFYEEIRSGNLAAQAAAQANAVNARYTGQTCPNCGQPLDPGARFCPSCGTPVAQPEQPAPEAAPPASIFPAPPAYPEPPRPEDDQE